MTLENPSKKTQALLKTEEAAAIMGLSRRTLEAWRVRGGGPRYTALTRRAVRYRREDLETFIQAGERASTSDQGQARP